MADNGPWTEYQQAPAPTPSATAGANTMPWEDAAATEAVAKPTATSTDNTQGPVGKDRGMVAAVLDNALQGVAVPGKPDWNMLNAVNKVNSYLPASIGGATVDQENADDKATQAANPNLSLAGKVGGMGLGAYAGGNIVGGMTNALGMGADALGTAALGRTGGVIPQAVADVATNPTVSKAAAALSKVAQGAGSGAGALPNHPIAGAALGAAGAGVPLVSKGLGAVDDAATAAFPHAWPLIKNIGGYKAADALMKKLGLGGLMEE
jgi:hypothetical protein